MSAETLADRRLHPSSIWINVIRSLRGWAIPAGVFAVVQLSRGNGLGRLLKWVPLGIMVVVVLGGLTFLFSWLAWSRFRYGIGERDVVVQQGVLNKVRRSIPLARVQDVNIEQGPLARLFGVAQVKIETGGGAADEGLLEFVSLAEADRLRAIIRQAGTSAPPAKRSKAASVEDVAAETAAAVATDGRVIFAMTLGRLAVAGLFGFSLFYLAAAFAVVETLGDILAFDPFNPRTWRRFVGVLTFKSAAGLVFAVAVLGVVFGAGRVILRDYGFKLWKEGERFRRERGLFTRSQIVVPLRRIQLAKVATTPLRKLFGWFELSLQTLGGAVATDAAGRQSIAPFAKIDEIAAILMETGRDLRLPDGGVMQKVSSRRLWTKLAPLVVPSTVIGIVSLFLPMALWGYVLIGAWAAHTALDWRFYRYALVDGLLFVNTGVLKQRLWIAPPASSQTISLHRSFLQRALGLATVVIDTAGATGMDPLQVQDLREARARELVEALRAAARPAPPTPRRRRAPKPKAQP